MSYQQPPTQPPPGAYPPQPPPPPGYGYGYPYGAPPPPPSGSRLGPGVIVAVFVGVLVALSVVAGVVIFLNQPPPPIPDCQPGEACAPRPTLPPISQQSPFPSLSPLPTGKGPTPQPSPTTGPTAPSSPGATGQPASPEPSPSPAPTASPGSDSPPALSGQVWRSETLGYSFEFNPEYFELIREDDDTAVFSGTFFDAQVVIEADEATTSVDEMIARELEIVDTFVIARVPDDDEYDALLGPGIGYVRGEGAVYGGTLVGDDGTPLAPAGVVVMAATDGRLSVAVVLIVGQPDVLLGPDTHMNAVRDAADDFVKTFDWGTP